MSRLLPSNRTPLESALAAAMQLSTDAGVLRGLADSARCPGALLPWLAWARAVDGWDEAIADDARRQLVRQSFAIHKRKGTVWAVRRAFAALGVLAEFSEWHEMPGAAPYTFGMVAWVNDNPAKSQEGALLTPQLYRRLHTLLEATKNARSHYRLRIGARFDQGIAIATAVQARALQRGSAETVALQPRAMTQSLLLANGSVVRAVAHCGADVQPVAVMVATTLSCACVFQVRAIVHHFMEAQ